MQLFTPYALVIVIAGPVRKEVFAIRDRGFFRSKIDE